MYCKILRGTVPSSLLVKRPAVNLYGGLVGQKQYNLKGL
jgi:hypothetical protein